MRILIKSLYLPILLSIVVACSTTEKLSNDEVKYHYSVNADLDEIASKDTSFRSLIYSYKNQLDSEMNVVISITDEPMMTGKPEGKLSNLIADAMMEIGKEYCEQNQLNHSVDMVLMNMGGIRTALPKGKITTGRVFEMLPFKNKLVIVGMKGENLRKLIEELAYFKGEAVSGLQLGIKDRKPVNPLVGGEPIEDARIYYVLSVDYLVNGGGGFTAFEKRETFRHLHRKLRSEIIKYMSKKYQKGEHLSAKTDGRIYHVD